MSKAMILVLRAWVIAGALYIVVSGVFYVVSGPGARADWMATVSSLVTCALMVGIPAVLYRRADRGTSLVGYVFAVAPVPLLLLVLSVLLWTDRDVAGGTITGRVQQWLAVGVGVAVAAWFLPARRRPALRPYQ